MKAPPSSPTYFLVHLALGANVEAIRSQLAAELSASEVLTSDELRRRSRSFWLFGTGAGAALFGSALLGVVVGTVIVGQTLYSSTKDHLIEFATLRAMGSSRAYSRVDRVGPPSATSIRGRERWRLAVCS